MRSRSRPTTRVGTPWLPRRCRAMIRCTITILPRGRPSARLLLERGEARVVFDPDTGTANIVVAV